MTITTTKNISDLEGILKLQKENLKINIDSDESEKEGFLTAEYDLDYMKTMHNAIPSIIAKDGDEVVGYALVTTKEIAAGHHLLLDLVKAIDSLEYDNKKLCDAKYVLIGQLCVAKNYRGIGLVNKMYDYFASTQKDTFEYGITDVAKNNPRSLKAHLNAGFVVLQSFEYGGVGWDIVLRDFESIV